MSWLHFTWRMHTARRTYYMPQYATECLGLTITQMRSLRNTWQCAVSHVFNVSGVVCVSKLRDAAMLISLSATLRENG